MDTNHKIRFFLSAILALLLLGSSALAAEIEAPPAHAVVFLLDASNSMNGNDRERLAKDSIAQLIYSLPSNYSVGFAAYNTEVVSEIPLQNSDNREAIMTAAGGVRYTGYTNAGAGLAKALEQLEQSGAAQKTVVILSDGEIVMQNDAATAESSAQFRSAVSSAQDQGISIHVIGLGADMADNANTIFSASEATGGAKYHAPKASDIQSAIDSILMDQLQVKKTTAATVDTDGGLENLEITIPSSNAAKVRVLFTSSSPIQNLRADFNAGDVRQFDGVHYTLLELHHPTAEQIHVSFQGQVGSRVRVDVITEYALTAKVETAYTDTEPDDPQAAAYDRTAEISIAFFDAENPARRVLEDAAFQGLSTPLSVNGKAVEGSLQNGSISFLRSVTEEEDLSVQIDLSRLETNLFLEQPIQIQLEAPPLLPPPPDYRPYLIAGAAMLLALILGLILWIRARRKHRPQPIPEPAPPPASKFHYTGRLSIYITRTRSGYDIPPLTYNLFRLPGSKVLSLQEILDSCNVEEQFEGADQIYFKAGADRCLVLTNDSDCTLMQNREILMKNRSYQIIMGSKVDITFEDEFSELALQYKEGKPSDASLSAQAR